MVIADFIVAPFLAAGALWLIRMGVNIWRSPGGDSRLQLMVMGWDRAVLMMGIFLMWLAVAALGQAVLDVTKVAGSQLGLWRRLGRNVRVCLLVRKHLVLQQAAVSGPTGVAAPAGHASCRERLLGPDHPDTLLSRNNLANAYQDAGRTDEAITLNQQNLADVERVLGPDHPNTLTSRLNLGTAYRDAGGWMKLKPCYIAPSDIPD